MKFDSSATAEIIIKKKEKRRAKRSREKKKIEKSKRNQKKNEIKAENKEKHIVRAVEKCYQSPLLMMMNIRDESYEAVLATCTQREREGVSRITYA